MHITPNGRGENFHLGFIRPHLASDEMHITPNGRGENFYLEFALTLEFRVVRETVLHNNFQRVQITEPAFNANSRAFQFRFHFQTHL